MIIFHNLGKEKEKIMINIPSIVPMLLLFKTTDVINKLPHYHGAHWYALFRGIFEREILDKFQIDKYNIWTLPTDYGVTTYRKGQMINLGLTFHEEYMPAVMYFIQNFNAFHNLSGHFQPQETISLEKSFRRIQHDDYYSLNYELIEREVDMLIKSNKCTLYFNSPLRLKKPEGCNKEVQEFCDEEFFFEGFYKKPQLPVKHLLDRIRVNKQTDIYIHPSLRLIPLDLIWIPAEYNNDRIENKGMGGMQGKLQLEGIITEEVAELLVIGQYVGIGNNPNFGFGFYNIPETDPVKSVGNLARGETILERTITKDKIKSAIDIMTNTATGEDRLSIEDVRGMEEDFIDDVLTKINEGTYHQQRLRKVLIPKNYAGDKREIIIQSIKDKIIHKTVQMTLDPILDDLLSHSSYAFRKGITRKQAATDIQNCLKNKYVYGLKADIEDFFNSINLDRLKVTLEAFFPYEPLVDRIIHWYKEMNAFDTKGLPQGSPLSPMLSNIYLDDFDREMERKGFKVFRYCDDFVLLSQESKQESELVKLVSDALEKYKLKINPDKTELINEDKPIKFIGYSITKDRIKRAERNTSIYNVLEWEKLFSGGFEGITIYLSYETGYAHTKGYNLIISENKKNVSKQKSNSEDDLSQDKNENIFPWSSIDRIIIIGRARISQGAIYKAINEQVPITFLSVTGKTKANLNPYFRMNTYLTKMQEEYSSDKENQLIFAKDIIRAKINNSAVLMKRNGIDISGLKMMEERVDEVNDLDSLRGIEGVAAKMYFGYFGGLTKPFEFKGRVYHPPEGEVNAMLSFGYTLLYNRISSSIFNAGFNARLGLFHVSKGRHYALASDLMEPLRHIIDRIVLSMIHRSEIKKEDFVSKKEDFRTVNYLNHKGFRKFISKFENTMASEFTYKKKKRISYNQYIEDMVSKYIRCVKLGVPYKYSLRIR